MKTWLIEHRHALAATFGQLRHQTGSALLNILVVGIALALPLAGFTLLASLQPLSGRLASEAEISVFMKLEALRADTEALGPRLKALTGVEQVVFVPREEALDKLRAQAGMKDVIAALETNPLPDAWVLKLKPVTTGSASDFAVGIGQGIVAGIKSGIQAEQVAVLKADAAAEQEKLAQQIRTMPQVEHVQIDSAWVRRMEALVQFLRLGLSILAAALGLAVIAVIFNTVRLQVLTQREEIEVSQLVGATNRFIRRPFYYMGALQGLCGGVLALGLVVLALLPLNAAVGDFARLYASNFAFQPLPPASLLGFLAVAAALGWLGAMLSVNRHLARLVPRR